MGSHSVTCHPSEVRILSYLYHCVWRMEWSNGLYSTHAGSRQPTLSQTRLHLRLRVIACLFLVNGDARLNWPCSQLLSAHESRIVSWCSLDRSRHRWTCLRQQSVTVVCAERVATCYSTPDTLQWTLCLWLNIKLHWLLQKSIIDQSLWIWNVRRSIKIYNKISSRYCILFNLRSFVLNRRCIWPVWGQVHGLSQTLVHGAAISRASATLAYSDCDCAPNSER